MNPDYYMAVMAMVDALIDAGDFEAVLRLLDEFIAPLGAEAEPVALFEG